MGRPRRDAHDVATPERILRAAIVEFARAGYEAARLEDIAARAHIQRPAVLYHYPTKLALYEAVCGRIFDELVAMMMAGFASAGSIDERVAGIARRVDAHFDKHPARARLVLRELLTQSPRTKRAVREVAAPILDLLEETIVREAGPRLRPGVPVRSALLHLFANQLLSHSAGTMRRDIWKTDDTDTLARMLFLVDEKVPRRQGRITGS